MHHFVKKGCFSVGILCLALAGLSAPSDASPTGASELRTTPINLSQTPSRSFEANAPTDQASSLQVASQNDLQNPTISFTTKPIPDLRLKEYKSEVTPFRIAQTTDIQPAEPPPVKIDVQSPDQLPSTDEVKPTSVDPGRETRSGPSYLGVGANIGALGSSSIGDIGLMVYSKIGLTRYFSIRPAITTNFVDDATFLVPATFDLAPIRLGSVSGRGVSIAPYIGAGAAVTTNGEFGPLLTGRADLFVREKRE
jgi:hypothetical protein